MSQFADTVYYVGRCMKKSKPLIVEVVMHTIYIIERLDLSKITIPIYDLVDLPVFLSSTCQETTSRQWQKLGHSILTI